MTSPKIPVDLILSKLAEDAQRVGERASKASDVLLEPMQTDLATTPYEMVYEEDRVRLKYYKSTAPEEKKVPTPLLVVYALINRETMLDLQPGRSVVERMLADGLDIYMIDWGYPGRKDRYLTIDDHVNGYMDNVVDFIRQRHGIDKVNLMGICMGGTFSVIYSALHPHKIQNLVTTVTPTNFDTDQGLLHLWMRHVDADKMVDTFANIPGDFLNFGFLLLNPARLMIDKYVGFLENIDNKNFVENFIRMEKWIFDSPDVPGDTFRQFVKDCYQKNLLIQSKMVVGGQRVDLKKLTMPLLNIYGQYDHLVPPAACERLTGSVGSKDTEDLCLKTGHIGIYVSSRYQQEFAPKIANWLRQRETAPPKTPKTTDKTTRKAAPRKSGTAPKARPRRAPAKRVAPAKSRPAKN